MELVDPQRRFHRSFLAAVDEFVAAGEQVQGPHAQRARALAAKARAIDGMAPAAPVFTFEMSFQMKTS